MGFFSWMWRTSYPVSFATLFVWGFLWALIGAAQAALEYLEGPEGLATALFLLIPMPPLLWATVRLLKRDRRLPAGA